MEPRRARRMLCAAALVVAVAGCGVTTQEHPRRVRRDDVPFGLLRESAAGERNRGSSTSTTATTTTTTTPQAGAASSG